MSSVQLKYLISTDNLKQAVTTAYDLYVSAGILPAEIVLSDGQVVFFNKDDARRLRNGLMTENEYFVLYKNAPM